MILRTFRDKSGLAPQKKEVRRIQQKRSFKRSIFLASSMFGDIPESVARDDPQLAQFSFLELSRDDGAAHCGSRENLHDDPCVVSQMCDRGPRCGLALKSSIGFPTCSNERG